MPPRREGNAAKPPVEMGTPEWKVWKTKYRAARCIRFIETYLVPPKGYGAGKRIRLAGFQKAWLEEVLAPGVSSAMLKLPRGNGKSTFLAAVALWALYDDDESGDPQVPVVAVSLQQIERSVYDVAVRMVKVSPILEPRTSIFSGIGTQRIEHPWNSGELFPKSKDQDGLQGLDPSFALADEIGFLPLESWESLVLASGKRPGSLVVGIGTPGVDRENALWHMEQRHAEGGIPGFKYQGYAAPEGADPDDEAVWRAANPAIDAGFKDIAAMRTLSRRPSPLHRSRLRPLQRHRSDSSLLRRGER